MAILPYWEDLPIGWVSSRRDAINEATPSSFLRGKWPKNMVYALSVFKFLLLISISGLPIKINLPLVNKFHSLKRYAQILQIHKTHCIYSLCFLCIILFTGFYSHCFHVVYILQTKALANKGKKTSTKENSPECAVPQEDWNIFSFNRPKERFLKKVWKKWTGGQPC